MAADLLLSPSLPFLSLLPGELADSLKGHALPPFRSKQLADWVYSKLITDPAAMTTFSVKDRTLIGRLFSFLQAKTLRESASSDGTRKLLLEWPGGAQAETVMIPDADRRTACVSAQVGCPVGCKFCASGLAGIKGNLTAAQIVEQVYQLNLLLAGAGEGAGVVAGTRVGAGAGERITNIVFMGMGEPLANYANVVKAIRVLHDPGCMNMSARRITLSTVGVPDKIRELAREELPINLALSLHAPNEELRRQLIPWAEHFALGDVLAAVQDYFNLTGREITLEYILLSGVNDRPQHARELVKLCRTIRANVNLIRYNEVPSLDFRRPSTQDVQTFQEILRAGGVNAHLRKSRGRDIEAACGQLRRKHEQDSDNIPKGE